MSVATRPVAHVVDMAALPTISILGPTIQFITGPGDDHEPCVMRGTIPPGGSIPLHSHDDPETFVQMDGAVEGLAYRGESWTWVPMRAGDVFHVPGGARHAFRNPGGQPAVMIVISTSKIARFFQELGVAAVAGEPPRPPTAAELRHFEETAARYGYWNASPEENAAVGLILPGPTRPSRPTLRSAGGA